jgi:hypothetical protein
MLNVIDRINGLYEELICLCEIRGSLSFEENAITEEKISKIEAKIKAMEEKKHVTEEDFNLDNRVVLWKQGYKSSLALSAEIIKETEKAIQFSVIGSEKERTFYLPKKAIKKKDSILDIAGWFPIEGYLEFIFNRYGSPYAR